VLSDKVVNAILSSGGDPFFIYVSYFSPHQPFNYAERHTDMFRTDEQYQVWRPPNFNEADVSDKPKWLQNTEVIKDTNWIDHIVQNSLRSLQSVDEGIARIFGALRWRRLLENTVILYFSDNGVTAGEHRFANGKNCPYEECLLFPLVIRHPDISKYPLENSELVQNIDIAPTIADFAGISIPARIDGESLVPLIFNHEISWREFSLIEHWQGLDGGTEGALVSLIPSYVGVRSSEWKYIIYETGEKELYFLVEDPYELENLAALPKFRDIIEELDWELNLLLKE
jgi:arylsulfatase A-like enzyme